MKEIYVFLPDNNRTQITEIEYFAKNIPELLIIIKNYLKEIGYKFSDVLMIDKEKMSIYVEYIYLNSEHTMKLNYYKLKNIKL